MTRSTSVMVFDDEGHLLFLRRGPTDPWMPGRWNFPGGKLDAGESFEEAALRELYEEAGIPAPRLTPVTELQTGPRHIVHLFRLNLPIRPPVESLDGEHDYFEWALPHEAPRPLVPWVSALLQQF